MGQAELIKDIFKNKQSRPMNTWTYDNGEFHSLSIDVSDFDVEADVMSFKPRDFPYFRVALLDKYLEETDAEK